jgi:centromere/kinetochore protein ZW10
VSLSDNGRELQGQVKDAASKVDLLKSEIDFNEHLYGTLQQIYDLRHTLDDAKQAVVSNELPVAIALLKKADRELSELPKCENTVLAGLIRTKCGELQKEVADIVTEQWNTLIHVDKEDGKVSIKQEIQRPEHLSITIDSVVAALSALNLLHGKIIHFQKEFFEVILTPRIRKRSDGTVASCAIGDGSIEISGRMSETSISYLFDDLTSMIELLGAGLPSSVSGPLSKALLPHMTSSLVEGPLSSSVPPDLDSIPAFTRVLDQTKTFISVLEKHGWHGKNHLLQWVADTPKLWLTRRTEHSLHTIRALLVRGLGDPRTVERVETQTVTKDDEMFANNGANEDWNAEWSDNDDAEKREKKESTQPKASLPEGDEEDVSAWGLDDDEDHGKEEPGAGLSKEGEDEGDAWGWGDDDKNEESPTSQRPPALPERSPKRNGNVTRAPPTERQVTLRETYNITALPEQILEIIIEVVTDAQTLAHSR